MISFSYLQQLAKYRLGDPMGSLETIDDADECNQTACGWAVNVDKLEETE